MSLGARFVSWLDRPIKLPCAHRWGKWSTMYKAVFGLHIGDAQHRRCQLCGVIERREVK